MNRMQVIEKPLERWVDVTRLDDIPRQGARKVDVDGKRIAVFRTSDDELFAIEDRCPHAGGPLSQGIVHGDCVTCPLHNWVISLRDGTAQGMDSGSTCTYPVRLDEDQVQIALHEPEQ